jgi:anti-sigma B factor antagonist
VTSGGQLQRCYPAGELDIASAALELAPEHFRDSTAVELDMRDVTFLDAFALGQIVALRNLLLGRGAELRIINPRPKVERVFRLTGLDYCL